MANKFPPHLPPSACNLKAHYLWQRLKFLLFITFFSLVVGMSGASMVLGWLWPSLGSADIWLTSYQRPTVSMQLEDRIYKEMSNRIATVYKNTSKLSSISYLDAKLNLGEAVMISSDGWLVMYNPDMVGVGNKVAVLMSDGQVYETEKVVNDIYAGLVYLKIKGGQFKVVNFSDSIQPGDDIFVYQDSDWRYELVGQPVFTASYNKAHLDSAPVENYGLSDLFLAGKIAINSQGRVVGFITKENRLLSSVYITRVLSQFLNNKFLQYPSLGVDGWFNDEQAIVVNNQPKVGLVVSGVWSSSQLQIGDVVLQINGLVVNEANLWYIISNYQKVDLKVLRGNKILEFAVPVVKKVIK